MRTAPSNRLGTYQLPDVGQGLATEIRSYDADLRLTSVLRPDGKLVTFQYDTQKYRLKRIVSPRGNTDFGYHPATGQLTSITEPDGQGVAFEYDGPLVTRTTWTGEVNGSVERSYDSDLRLAELRVNGENPIPYRYDDDSRLIQVGDMTITRDPATGRELTTTLGNVTTERTYTAFGEPATYTAKFAGNEIYFEAYTYNKNGWIVDLERRVHGASTLYHYVYDLRGRLTEVWENGSLTSSYTYDANSNRLSYTGPLGNATATYDARDRLLTYGDATYTYTEAGELATKTENGLTTTYDYDVFGNLRRVDLTNGIVVEYLNDGAQRRIGEKIDGVLVKYWLYQDLLEPIAEFRPQEGSGLRFIYGTRSNIPDYLIQADQPYRVVADQLGSPRQIVHVETGLILQESRYDEYGRIMMDSNPGFQPFGFTGGLHSGRTGFTKMGARDFDSNCGRWSAGDPIPFGGRAFNSYEYALNSPLSYLDLLGTDEITQDKTIQECMLCIFKKAEYGRPDYRAEESAWIVKKGNGYGCIVWPSSESSNKTKTSGVPQDVAGLVHTHPTRTSRVPSGNDINLVEKGPLKEFEIPIYVIHRDEGISKYDPKTDKITKEEPLTWAREPEARCKKEKRDPCG